MPRRPVVVSVTVTDKWSPLHLCRANKRSRGEAGGVESRLVWREGNGVRNWGQLIVCMGDHADCGNWGEFVRFFSQVVHVEEVVYSSHYVECQALQNPWVALKDGLSYILKNSNLLGWRPCWQTHFSPYFGLSINCFVGITGKQERHRRRYVGL